MNFTVRVYDVAKLYQVLMFCRRMLASHVIILFLVQIKAYKPKFCLPCLKGHIKVRYRLYSQIKSKERKQ